MRARMWLALIVLVATSTAVWAAKPARRAAKPAAQPVPSGLPTADQLIYPGATVETRIDVNGVAAMQLAGGAVDALTQQMQQQLQAAQSKQGEEAEAARAQAEAIEQARTALKSLTGVKVVVMHPKGPVKASNFINHYQGLMSPRGWTPMVTVQDEKEGNAVLVMLGPAGKGLFVAVSDKEDIVSGLVATSAPLGDLIGTIMKSGSMGQVMGSMAGSLTSMLGKPKPPEPPEAATPPAPAEQPEPAPEPEEPEAPEAPEG